MSEIRHTVETSVPRERIFAYVDDYTTVPEWMFGVTEFTPITEQTSGVGATFESTMRIGPKALKSTLEVTEWIQDEVIVMSSVGGIDVRTAWRFADRPDGTTDVAVEFDYELPGGFAGRALAALVEPVVGQAINQTERSLRAQLED